MEQFTIIKEIPVDIKMLQVLNTDFDKYIESEHWRSYNSEHSYYRGRLSSYHYFSKYFTTWKQNIFRDHNATLCIAHSEKSYQAQEALDFMHKKNGYSLSRDNLFMLPEVFPKQTLSLSSSSIIAPSLDVDLNLHNSGFSILPMLKIEEEIRKKKFDYSFCDSENTQTSDIAFFTFSPPVIMRDNYKEC
jgi:hypothetical protein